MMKYPKQDLAPNYKTLYDAINSDSALLPDWTETKVDADNFFCILNQMQPFTFLSHYM